MEKLKIYKYNYSSFQSIFELSGNNVPFIAGPCSIEDENQLERVAVTLNKNNVKFIRGGAYKPRTSPYDFQGLGIEGLKLILRSC